MNNNNNNWENRPQIPRKKYKTSVIVLTILGGLAFFGIIGALTNKISNETPTSSVSSTVQSVSENVNSTSSAKDVESSSSQVESEINKNDSNSISDVASTSSSTPKPKKEDVVYWGNTGAKYHINSTCRSFKGDAVNSGTLTQAKSVRDSWCQICSKGLTDEMYLSRLEN